MARSRKLLILLSLITGLLLTAGAESLFAIVPAPAPDMFTAAVSGYIKDKKNGETLVGATVLIKGTKKGTFTNKAGYYSITGIEPGEQTIVISMIGYNTVEQKITCKAGEVLRKDYSISETELSTGEVTVEAQREIEQRQISVSKVNIPIKQIKEIRIGGESDVMRSLQMLPGVLASSQISSGLYIRGGSPDQNLILLDGSTVYNPSHLFGFISTFNSDAIKDVELIKGGYPAEYGGRMSAVLNITQKDGNSEEFEGGAALGLISSKLSLQGPIGNGSWFIGGRRTYFDLIKGLMEEDPESPIPDFGFWDLNAKISQNIDDNNKVFASGFMSRDDFDYSAAGIGFNMFVGNTSGSIRWNSILSDNLFFMLNFTSSNYTSGFEQDISGYKIKVENKITDYNLKGNIEWFAGDDWTFKSGFEIIRYLFSYESDFTGEDKKADEGTNEGGVMNIKPKDWTYSIFAQANYRITDLISMQLGLRGNYWEISDIYSLDPRVALRWQVTEDFAVKASGGVFHQYLRLAGLENFSLFDTWLPTDSTVNPSRAYHFILSFETKPFKDFDFNIDLYYKQLENISELNQSNLEGSTVSDVFFSGKGSAYGGEIFLQKRAGKFVGWIGYALGWVEAEFDSINGGRKFRPKYDRRHDLKIVGQYELDENWDFGMQFVFQSGQSYTGGTSRYQAGLPGSNLGKGIMVPSEKYGLRLPASHQLNISAGYKFDFFGLPARMILDIYNVYSRRDILFRYYETTDLNTTVTDIKLLPIIPTFSFEVKF